MVRTFLFLGTLFALLSVALGAFGAHILRDRLSVSDLAIFQTGVQYQGFHAFALILVGMCWMARPKLDRLKLAGWLFVGGTIIFSGSLYALSLTGVKWLGAITPIGGVCFLTGWLIAAMVAASLPEDPHSS